MHVSGWLEVSRGDAPLLVSLPHTGTEIPTHIEGRLASAWVARKDTDWWIDKLYDFAADLGATTIRTRVSRTVIDVNRDPAGTSLCPGQATTELCPTTTFDGERLYRDGTEPDDAEVAERRIRWFDPCHAALDAETARLKTLNGAVVIYDCHSIRSVIPRLFDGELPVFNIGTNGGVTCVLSLQQALADLCAVTGSGFVVNGRFRGGYMTRRLGCPSDGVQAVQMELACCGYLREPIGVVHEGVWPPAYDAAFAAPIRQTLRGLLASCLTAARG